MLRRWLQSPSLPKSLIKPPHRMSPSEDNDGTVGSIKSLQEGAQEHGGKQGLCKEVVLVHEVT